MRLKNAKYLSKNQLIRIKEIFKPFFDTLNDTCISYSIYRVSVQGTLLNNRRYVSLDFTVSDEGGHLKQDSLMYDIDADDLFYSDKFKFVKNSEKTLLSSIKRMIEEMGTIPIDLNKLVIENGTSWTLGVIGPDVDRHTGTVYDGAVLFLKSNLYFEQYSLKESEIF